jgi:hypothetical protein
MDWVAAWSGVMQRDEYGSFLVRIWYAHQDGDRKRRGRAEVVHVQSGARWSFHTYDTLLAFLQRAARRMQPLNDRRLTINRQARIPVFVHVASEVNTRGNQTVIDHPMTNDNPHAILIITRCETLFFHQQDDGLISPPHAESFSVAYSSRAAKWSIHQPAGSGIPPGAAFNVLVFKM